jgi:hypothetical protein
MTTNISSVISSSTLSFMSFPVTVSFPLFSIANHQIAVIKSKLFGFCLLCFPLASSSTTSTVV